MFWIWIFVALMVGALIGFGLATLVHVARCADCAIERDYANVHLWTEYRGPTND